MEVGASENITPLRSEIEVFYVPDTIIETIIPNEKVKLDGRRKKSTTVGTPLNNVGGLYRAMGMSPRVSRSGRQITNKLEALCLNEGSTPRKSAATRENTEPEAEEWGEDIEKPQDNLFEEEEVDGGTLFSFKTPKRESGMVRKASEWARKSEGMKQSPVAGKARRSLLPDSPSTSKSRLSATPSQSRSAPHPPKTPYTLRTRLKNRIAIEAEKQELDRLLEDSGSEYNPSSSDSESEGSTDLEGAEYTPDVASPSENPQQYQSPAKKTRQQLKDYTFSSDDYFDRRFSRNMTSNNTLKKLKTPKIGPSQLTALLNSLPKTHAEAYNNLLNSNTRFYKRWIFAMSEGYNIMLYGLGSKRPILMDFHKKYLAQRSYTIEINGYFPENMVKEILVGIATRVLNIRDVPSQPHEIIAEIGSRMNGKSVPHLYLLVLGLDGKGLRNDKAQSLISQLVSFPKIHMIATVDHINSPLMWDQNKLSAFNFIWEDATTFQIYKEETSFEGSLMVNWGGGIAISSLKSVFASLTANSRKVFMILLKYQLEHHGPKYSGMHFSDLYRECRAGFVVSSDLALRTLLTEFIDHQLLKWRKESDHLVITVELHVLKQFQNEIA